MTYYYDDATRPDLLTRVADAASATKGFKYLASATSPHYTYDLNGNLTLDKHKTITFTYNHLNLPNTMTLTGGSAITMTYTADGEKLTKVSPAGTRNYVAGIEYLGANTEAIYHTEGRCTPNGASAFHYEYTLKDHLGNARVNFRANGTAVSYLEDFHYYPFGMAMEGLGSISGTGNDYRYNGKELNEDLGLNWSDFGKRWYDPTIGRFPCVDPIAEKFPHVSIFNYAENEPIANIDLWGLQKAKYTLPNSNLTKQTTKAVINLTQKINQGRNAIGNALNNLVNKIIPEGNPPIATSSDNMIGSGFEQLTNDNRKSNGQASTSQSKDASSILMVDEMLFPKEGMLSAAASTSTPLVNFIDNTASAIQNIDEAAAKINVEPDKEAGTRILPGVNGAPDTLKTTSWSQDRKSSTTIMKPLKKP